MPKSGNKHISGFGTGVFLILGFATLTLLAKQVPGSALQLALDRDAIAITARFDDAGDLKAGAPVTIAGVRIGGVESIALDATQHRAIVTVRIDKRYSEIPNDSSARIEHAGLLGAEFVALEPGGSRSLLREGSQINHTQSAIMFENLVKGLLAHFWGRR